MTALENIRVQFQVLLEEGSLAKSHCSGGFLQTIKPLLASDVLLEERSSGGRRIVVRDRASLSQFYFQRFPNVSLPAETPNRVAALARYRDTKALPGNTPDLIVLRSWSDAALWKNGQPVAAMAATREHGAFSFMPSAPEQYELRVSCALVENPVVFAAFEKLRIAGAPIVLYSAGRVSGRVLNWLANQRHTEFRVLHLPDYDPVGLSEFERLREALGTRATLHLPPDLPARFSRYGNRDLLNSPFNQTLLANLRHSPDPQVKEVTRWIQEHNAGLEQEALLLSLDQI